MRLAGGLGSRAATELGEHVADVHVDGPRAEEELARDLAVRSTHRDEAQDLELSSCQAAALQVAGRPAAETLIDAFAGVRHGRRSAVREWALNFLNVW